MNVIACKDINTNNLYDHPDKIYSKLITTIHKDSTQKHNMLIGSL